MLTERETGDYERCYHPVENDSRPRPPVIPHMPSIGVFHRQITHRTVDFVKLIVVCACKVNRHGKGLGISFGMA